MSSALEKSLNVLELMSRHPEGVPVSLVADTLDMPVSGAHRVLKELARLGYIRQKRNQGDYVLTIKLAALGLNFLGRAGVVDIAQPILDRLAAESGELIRLGVLENERIIYVANAQGATMGLRYDPGPEQGTALHLSNSSGGLCYLATLSDEDALRIVSEQGLLPTVFQPIKNTPRSLQELLSLLAETRERGYGLMVNSYHEGMAAMAVPVRYDGTGDVVGILSIAGPEARMSREKIDALVPALEAAATEIGGTVEASQFFRHLHTATRNQDVAE